MTQFIKICGLHEYNHAEAAVNAGATHLGFVFFPKSPRNIELDKAAKLARQISKNTIRIALLVDPTEVFLDSVLTEFNPDAIQLHGCETPERVAHLNHKVGAKTEIWKAVGMARPADVDAATQYNDVADKILFDASSPKGADRPGGHGAAFDWSILRSYRGQTPWLLAGGLDADNIGEAIAACAGIPGFAGVDVSSGVETAPGEKSVEKIEKFIYAAKAAYRGVG